MYRLIRGVNITLDDLTALTRTLSDECILHIRGTEGDKGVDCVCVTHVCSMTDVRVGGSWRISVV